jgi:hypothetical protein
MFTRIKQVLESFRSSDIIITTKGKFLQLTFSKNSIFYLQGGLMKNGIPSHKPFFVDTISNTIISLRASGYGISPNNKFGIQGTYGEGPLIITPKKLPKKVYKILQASRSVR